ARSGVARPSAPRGLQPRKSGARHRVPWRSQREPGRLDDLPAGAVPGVEPTPTAGSRGGHLRSLRSVVLVALTLVAIGTRGHANDCNLPAKLKAVEKKESRLLGCQSKVAATGASAGL